MIQLYAYHVSYDLNSKPKPDYESLYAALKATAWAHPLESTWIIKTDETAVELYDRLRRHMHRNDSLFISQVNGNHAGWLLEIVWTWLHSIPTSAGRHVRP